MTQPKKSDPTLTFKGWGQYPTSQSSFSRPESLTHFNPESSSVLARGLGRSYGDASLNTNRHLILTEKLNRFTGFDTESGLLSVEAGTTLEEILNHFVPRGWFLPVTPGTKQVTVGGCIAADVHGKNHHIDGTIGAHVKELELLIADGSRLICSPTQNRAIFNATIGGMGLTGIITEAKIQLIPISSAYMVVEHHPAKNLDAALNILSDTANDAQYSVAWIDCLARGKGFGRSIVMNGRHASADELKNREPLILPQTNRYEVPFTPPDWVLNPWTIKTFNACFYHTQKSKRKPFITDYDHYFYPLDALEGWNRLYGKRGFIQYQFVVPTQSGHEAMRKILQELTQAQRGSFLAVLKKFGKQGDGLLSFPMEGYTLALDIPITGEDLFPFLDHLDQIVLRYEGRVYLAKDARLQPESFCEMYTNFSEFLKIKQEIDPKHLFSSDLSRRLMGGIAP